MLHVQKAKNEDVIATVLTRQAVKRLYRFYGARHSILQLGYLVDFEIQEDHASFLPRMRSLSHFPFPWIFDMQRLMIWQNLMQRLYKHFHDTEEIDTFYYDTLLETAKRWDKQNPKRLAVEFYVRMLEFEGRLYEENKCYVCDKPFNGEVALMVGYKPAHPQCIYAPSIHHSKLASLFRTYKSTFLDDHEIQYLFHLMMQGF